jgi:dihydropteroate synthase/2-amino-4-hydroxy-6-hydroxymethyldihydropteridine diphosphokinase
LLSIAGVLDGNGHLQDANSMVYPVILALGSNLGHRQQNLQQAVNALGKIIAIDGISPLYETEPWGLTEQPAFLNCCLKGQTILKPEALLAACKKIERRMGREPAPRWGPRLIDIDLISVGQLMMDNEPLSLPHPRLAERAFVLAPLADIAPDFSDQRSGRPIQELLANVDLGTVRRLAPEDRLLRPVQLAWGVRTYVMGILNSTPDSFSGDGLMTTGLGDDQAAITDRAVTLAQQFEAAGADILDVGGESTRPGSAPISKQEELDRILPILMAVRAAVSLPLSVDTYRATVAEQALAAGADWVNDVWGLRMDSQMAGMVAEAGCPVVIMHNRSRPKDVSQELQLGGRYVGVNYDNLLVDISQELQTSIDLALGRGVRPEQIIIDPGIGFGKTVEQNLELLNSLSWFKQLSYPILAGSSRKSFIGYTLNLPPEERLEGTAATVAIAIDRGADIVRVHDVRAMVRVARMTDAIVRDRSGP